MLANYTFSVDRLHSLRHALAMSQGTGVGCINGDGREGASKCFKCGALFCRVCLAYSVNDDPYCEPCANRLIDDLKPPWPLIGAILVGSFAVFLLGNGLYWANFHSWSKGAVWLGIVLFVGAGRWALHLADPAGTKPRIDKRYWRYPAR